MMKDGATAGRGGSLRRKLMVVVMAATLAALLCSASALLLYEVHHYRQSGIEDLTTQADLISQSVAPTLAFDDPKAARAALAALQLRPQVQAAAVYHADGSVFATYPANARLPTTMGPDGAHFVGGELVLFHRILQGGETLGILYLRERHDLAGRIAAYLWILLAAMAGGLGLAWWIFRYLHPAVTGPILAVADASRRVMEERNYDIRVAERSDDEVGVLVDAFNSMLDELSVEMKERRHAEEALREADRRKDVFLATLAHELRNPLAPLTNALAILERAEDNPQLRATARAMMGRQLAQLVRLIDDLLEVSRITRGKIELRRQKVDVVAIARSALEAAEPALRARGHAFGADLPDKPLWIDADGARLTQVFVNLLHNAAKYTDAGGRVQLAVREAEGHAVIDVRDNGIGIAPEEQQSVFEMFVQLDKSLGRGAAGLGVGLTIAKQLVELHQGTLTLHSVGLGQGSTFTVALPIVTPPLQSDDGAARAPRAEPAGTGLDVLVADDNTDFAISFANVLRMEGHQVRVVHDGVSALKACIDATPDVAFLDIGMPELDGYELGARMRERDDLRSVVLVAVTGWGQAEDRHKVRLAGYDHHWVKPVDMQRALKLLDTLRAERSAMKTPERG